LATPQCAGHYNIALRRWARLVLGLPPRCYLVRESGCGSVKKAASVAGQHSV